MVNVKSRGIRSLCSFAFKFARLKTPTAHYMATMLCTYVGHDKNPDWEDSILTALIEEEWKAEEKKSLRALQKTLSSEKNPVSNWSNRTARRSQVDKRYAALWL